MFSHVGMKGSIIVGKHLSDDIEVESDPTGYLIKLFFGEYACLNCSFTVLDDFNML